MCGHDVVIGVCRQRSCRGAHFGAVFLKHSVSLKRPENVTFLHRKAVHGVVVAPWGGAVVVLALADVRSLLGCFAMQSRQRFVHQLPLLLDDFSM
tara:strand:+ start:194 stop:478 length:285 start_codon:yes stop_codon:yes gene_type:complete